MISAPRACPPPARSPATSATGSATIRNVSELRKASTYWRESGVWSRSWITSGMSVTVSEIDVPSSAVRTDGQHEREGQREPVADELGQVLSGLGEDAAHGAVRRGRSGRRRDVLARRLLLDDRR